MSAALSAWALNTAQCSSTGLLLVRSARSMPFTVMSFLPCRTNNSRKSHHRYLAGHTANSYLAALVGHVEGLIILLAGVYHHALFDFVQTVVHL
jgi:hypothetical protein